MKTDQAFLCVSWNSSAIFKSGSQFAKSLDVSEEKLGIDSFHLNLGLAFINNDADSARVSA